MKIACIFPGQGAQAVGMGLNLSQRSSAAKETFDKIDKIAGRSLSNLCFFGPGEELRKTINTQPAILATSIVAWESYLEAGGPKPSFVAGHSLGEFTALYAANVLTLEATVKLVEKRAQLMEACPPGAMSAILGMKYERLKEICAATTDSVSKKVVIIANFNTEEQLVISGDPDSVASVGAQAKTEGAKVIPLAVSGAFHSPLMIEAANEFTDELNKCTFAEANYPIVQNVTAIAHTNGIVIKNTLQKQMTSSVLWYSTIRFMLDQGVTHFIEIGPGKALSGMIKRISKTAQAYNIEDSASLNNTLNNLRDVALAG